MKPGEIKRITNNAIVHIPGDVCLERVSSLSLRVEARPVAVKSTASLLWGYLNADYIEIDQSYSS